ncbi:M14 family metallopeptidase [Sphingobacterium sp. UT-1RO-CII-1]|uniref:M14 family metallopeptidase n=1 Tax=Sphingobacterium sp. UT-1RO-CII-1 TaxID=2995225 RepID=UPI00227C1F48|nr:M14 metallopeptidase family protein [Sphingobacterium sp. UT-1RO-CII-1]MCY4779302.1 M14 family metallopeptidase [Sphingobacterium sp. UT-1RO-CII-1]
MKIKSILSCLLALAIGTAHAQQISDPKSHFGFEIGEDYKIANYKMMESYFLKVAKESNRVHMEKAGMTEEGRQQYLLVISSPENLANREKYRQISQSLGRAEGISEEEAKKLSTEGKPIVWIDGGMHSNEMVGSHQLIETLYKLTSSNEKEILNYLDKVVVLMWHVNPDGQDLLADWYMQYEDPTKRNMSIPTMYQKYVGHDNNRDFFMYNMKEATNLAKVMYVDWLPQIVYNHHQTSPEGTVVAGPPYRDPFNHVYDPLVVSGIDGVGFAMINRLNEEDKPGYVRMDQSMFSTWWNGGLRTSPYFHNMIGILTETTGSPTPSEIPFVAERQIPRNGLPNPIAPQKWHFKRSIDYSVSMNLAILDYAARNGDKLLYNFYKMGKNSIDRGSSNHWTAYPKYIDAVQTAYQEDIKSGKVKTGSSSGYNTRRIPASYYDSLYRSAENRDPRVFILPADQADFGTAVKFVNALIKSGVYVYQANDQFTVNGKQYPKNSIIVKTNQAFRPQIIDMFEPQDHPHDTEYEGGPPVRPYDAAGWTLGLQMGVQYDRFYEDVTGPFDRKPHGVLLVASSGNLSESKGGYLINGKANDAFLLANRLINKGIKLQQDIDTKQFYVTGKQRGLLQELSQDLGLTIETIDKQPKNLKAVKPLKIGLFDHYGGSMPSGWVRWILEQYGFSYELFYPKNIDNNDIEKYDILLFVGQGIPSRNAAATMFRQPDADLVPEKYAHLLGQVSRESSIPILKKYVENGGQVLTIGSSSELVYHFGLPITDPLMKIKEDGKQIRLSSSEYYIPTSILQASLDLSKTENAGMTGQVNIVFNNSPVFKVENNADIYALGSITTDKPLLSGWAHGQQYLKGTSIGVAAKVGKGKLIAFGPEITNRAQSHATFKLLFNQLYN